MSIRRETRRRRDGSTYEAIVVDVTHGPPGKLATRVTRTPRIQTMDAARKLERAVLAELEAGTWGKEVKQARTLAAFAEEFLKNYVAANNKPSEAAAKKRILEQHILPVLGEMNLDAIGVKEIERYKARKLEEKLSRKTVNNHLHVISKMLRVAVEWSELATAPRAKLLKVGKSEFDFLDFEEARRLVEACTGQLRTMVVTLLNTGLRWGELVALRWQDVDLKAGRIVVRQNVWRGHIGTPKGGRAREIPLNEAVLSVLREHRHLRGEWVFCTDGGTRLGDQAETSRLESACRRAGLRNVTWHVLRHTFASHLVMRGVPIKAVQELLGHQDIQTTMRYAHLAPSVMRDAVAALTESSQRRDNATVTKNT